MEMQSAFAGVAEAEWSLRESVSADRRERLLHGPSFEQIVVRLVDEARLLNYKREAARSNPQFFRVAVTIEARQGTVDAFHNSSTGYRAQYYHSVANGARANTFAMKTLTLRVIALLENRPKRTCPATWVAKSLSVPDAKVWIHQGNWLRLAKRSDRVLAVARWLHQEQICADTNRRKKARWASLAPDMETRIDLKGAFISLDGAPLGNPKPTRAADIHELGFT